MVRGLGALLGGGREGAKNYTRHVWGIITAKRKLLIAASVAALVIIGALALTTFAAITTSQTVPSYGAVSASASLGLYSDSACTIPLSPVNWGTLTPGSAATRTIYVKNAGDLSLTLGMTASNWSPASANVPIAIMWDKEGITLSPGNSIAATLTLTVSSSVAGVTDFSAQINITGANSG